MMTPIQIGVLALAYDAFERGETICVWGSWQKAAHALIESHAALVSCGTGRGSRSMEWQNLGGHHRRGKEGRLVHVYKLTPHRNVIELASRCAWAVSHKPKGRAHVTWKDVPREIPMETWPEARTCPSCSCTTSRPCTIRFDSGTGQCVPAGAFGFKQCSACQYEDARAA